MSLVPALAVGAPGAYQAYKRVRQISPLAGATARFLGSDDAKAAYKAAATTAQRAYRAYRRRVKARRQAQMESGDMPMPMKTDSYAERSYPSTHRGHFDNNYTPNVNGFNALGQKALFSNEIEMPETGNGTSRRLTNQVYIKGFSFCLQFINPNPYPIEVHFALCQFGSDNLTATDYTSDFFRADNAGESTINFPDYTGLPNWDQRILCNPLSPENKRIITHRKWVVGGKVTGKTLKESGYILKHECYLPIKRKMSLENSNDRLPEKPYVWFLWALSLDPDDHDNANQKTVVRYQVKRRMYYSNII